QFMAFRADAAGRITHLLLGVDAFERLAWYESARVQVPLVGFAMVVFLSAVLGWTVAALARRLRGRHVDGEPGARLARGIAGVASLTGLGSVAAGAILQGRELRAPTIVYGTSAGLLAYVGLAHLAALAAIALPFFAARAWRRGWWARAGRAHYTLVTLAALYLVVGPGYWEQLGFPWGVGRSRPPPPVSA